MQHLVLKDRKDKSAKQVKPKNAQPCQHPLHTASKNAHTVAKVCTAHTVKSKLSPSPLSNNLHNAKKVTSNFFPISKAQSNGKLPVKAGRDSSCRTSNSRRNNSSKPCKSKSKLQKYLQAKVISHKLAAQGTQTTKQYFPLTHEEKQIQQYSSYLIGQNGERTHHVLVEPLTNSIKQTTVFHSNSGIVSQIPHTQQRFYDMSGTKKSEDALSKRQWQIVEALKLKNEQLSNYIEQLQRVEEKLKKQQEESKRSLQYKYEQEKRILLEQIDELKEEQAKLIQTNATLQQLFNQGKQNLDLITTKYHQLGNQSQSRYQERSIVGEKQTAQRRIDQLQGELRLSRNIIEQVTSQKLQSQQSLSMCRIEKDQIKRRAQEMLQMVRVMSSAAE